MVPLYYSRSVDGRKAFFVTHGVGGSDDISAQKGVQGRVVLLGFDDEHPETVRLRPSHAGDDKIPNQSVPRARADISIPLWRGSDVRYGTRDRRGRDWDGGSDGNGIRGGSPLDDIWWALESPD